MTDKILVHVSCSSAAEAASLARVLLDLRLVACASLGAPVQSFYVWQGERQETTEVPLLLKTRFDRFSSLAAEIRRRHSYENPEIIAVPVVAGSPEYLGWVDDSLA